MTKDVHKAVSLLHALQLLPAELILEGSTSLLDMFCRCDVDMHIPDNELVVQRSRNASRRLQSPDTAEGSSRPAFAGALPIKVPRFVNALESAKLERWRSSGG